MLNMCARVWLVHVFFVADGAKDGSCEGPARSGMSKLFLKAVNALYNGSYTY